MSLRAEVVVASNRAAAGVYADETGPLLVEFLRELGFVTGPPVVVPDGDPVGAAIGAAAGGFAGKGIADMIDPEMEAGYWRENWKNRDYIDGGFTYDQDYGPAYRYGVDAYTRFPERRYDEIETDLSAGWDDARGESRLDWDRAQHATRDAWQRVSDTVERATPGDSDRDGK